MRQYPLLNWFFYGHVQISLAATGLGWASLRLHERGGAAAGAMEGCGAVRAYGAILPLLFFATLGVYTLHRLLSFTRAGTRPTAERYNLVARYPGRSLAVGIGSLGLAVTLGLPLLRYAWPILLAAAPLTIFYLTPPLPGWRRLRDLPYLKTLWVALAWTLMTHVLPLTVAYALEPAGNGHAPGVLPSALYAEGLVRFLLTGSIAVLFDYRDLTLDRSQGVRTLAGAYPTCARYLVVAAMLVSILVVTSGAYGPTIAPLPRCLGYAAVAALSLFTTGDRAEWWFAVLVNGALVVGMVG